MRLEGLTHMAAVEKALQLDFNASSGHFNQTVLEAFNDEMFLDLAPVTAVLLIAMVIGVLGNCAVCFVFLFKLKVTAQNVLLLSLGIFDLLSCVVGVPSEIYDIRHYFLYESVAACKTLRFLTIVPSLASILVLLVIAVERYRKICYPLHSQFESRQIRYVVVVIILLSIVVSIPALFLYGHRSIKTNIENLYGRDCSVDDAFKDGAIPLAYEALLAAAFTAATLVLISLYVRILIETRRHTRYMKRHAIVGGRHWEERTLSSIIELPFIPEAVNNSHNSTRDRSRSSPHRKRVRASWLGRVRKGRKTVGEDRRVTSSDRMLDPAASEKIVDPDLCPQETNLSNSRGHDDVRFNSHSSSVRIGAQYSENQEDAKKKQTNGGEIVQKVHVQLETNRDSNSDILKGNTASAVALSHVEAATVAAIAEATTALRETNNSMLTLDKSDNNQFEKSMRLDRDISITNQPLLTNRDVKKSMPTECESDIIVTQTQANAPNNCQLSVESDEEEEDSTLRLNRELAHSIEIIKYEPEDIEIRGHTTTAPMKPTIRTAKSTMSLVKVRKAVSSRRATVMAFIITIGFIVSYLPHLILIILRAAIPDFEHGLNKTSLVFYNIFLRSYFTNNVINVFVYGTMNMEFREQLGQVWLKIRCRCCGR